MAIGPLALPIASGVFQMAGSLFGASRQRHAQKAAAAHAHILRQQQLANQAAQASYKHTFSDAMLDIENQRTQEVFDIKLGLYDDQIEINKSAANSASSAEQFKLNEQMEQAALNRNRMFKELIAVQGAQAARGGTASRSRDRADLINSLGEFGREQQEFNKTIYSARSAHNQRMAAIAGQHANADYTAWSRIAIAPALKLPGQGLGPESINVVGAAPVDTSIGFGDIMSGASAGLQTGISLAAISDYELKENIEHVGKSSSGIHIYEFSYIGENTRYRGAMAQDVIVKVPEAVSEMDNGYLGVNYDLIDVQMEKVKS